MLNVCLPGIGGMEPLPNRWLTCFHASSQGHSVLIDCGEGTQIALKEAGCSMTSIDQICLTHFHGDHVAGLPGLLQTMGNNGRTEPVTICGPVGLEEIVRGLTVFIEELPFPILLSQICGENQPAFTVGPMTITSFPAQHRIPCLGYVIELHRKGKFNVEKAQALNIPQNAWSMLQNGSSVEVHRQIITPDMVMGPARKGIKVLYSTDTRPVQAITERGKDSDLLVLEGIYPDWEKIEKAKKWKHMVYPEAAALALLCDARELWLTHISPSVPDPEAEIHNARTLFPNAYAGYCGMKKTLNFPKEEDSPEREYSPEVIDELLRQLDF